ncbi:MAG: dTDP-glucose 4,6-dehydratase [Candidatus Cloacimonetes bacterium]|nr:dTDP-glucose 4,6-dehydratase [Candidatus Cloacimonadota bacterium]
MSKRTFQNILITGGSGFIGSNFIHFLYKKDYSVNIINVDKLTYAGNPENLKSIEKNKNYFFYNIDICNYQALEEVFIKHEIDCVVHFAAESHVDRSIHGPKDFILTNIIGTFNLLEICRKYWNTKEKVLFHHISTDEVYGSLDDEGFFFENTPYDPRSPYSASKASSDHLVSAYFHTYGIPITISNCSNNYGPYQFPEKLIPLIILNIKQGKPLPIYGDGKNIRDWLWVDDHCSAILKIIQNGKFGDTYNIGGENEWENITLVKKICSIMAEREIYERCEKLITYVKDRPGHDKRYAINCDKIKSELGWTQSVDFETGLRKTINWYLENNNWIENIKTDK